MSNEENRMPDVHFRSLDKLEYSYWWHQSRLLISLALLQREHRLITNILDLGCGTGGFLHQLSDRLGVDEATGLDASPSALEACRRKGLDVIHGDLMKPVSLGGEHFDLVTAMDVVEHLEDPAILLRHAHAVLKDDGLLLVSVPAYQWMYSSWDAALGHHARYTRGRLKQLLAGAGFRVHRTTYAFSFILLPAMIRRLAGGKYDDDNCVFPPVPRVVNSLFSLCGRWESRLLQIMTLPAGLSVYALASKSQ